MTSKLFGQETPEQREAKLKVLEEQITEGEEFVKSKTLECEEYVQNAWIDIERFKEQKNQDLKEALISYAVMQISMCKKASCNPDTGTMSRHYPDSVGQQHSPRLRCATRELTEQLTVLP
ncbi:SNX4 protein, partial [Polypterus senegalus]